MLLVPQVTLQQFDKWAMDFVEPISPLGKRTGARYIITVKKYLTRWAEAAPVVDCIAATTMRFLFDNIVTRFVCPKILMRNQGSHFINHTFRALTEEIQIQHKKSTPYHQQANGIVEEFNKVLNHSITKVTQTMMIGILRFQQYCGNITPHAKD